MKKTLALSRLAVRRTRGLDYRAVENWEVTYNAEADSYHPHVHCVVRGKAQALAIREEWLKRCQTASAAAQDVRPWDGTVDGMKEMVKYCHEDDRPCRGQGPPAC